MSPPKNGLGGHLKKPPVASFAHARTEGHEESKPFNMKKMTDEIWLATDECSDDELANEVPVMRSK